jgi:Uma2 family endonuclease
MSVATPTLPERPLTPASRFAVPTSPSMSPRAMTWSVEAFHRAASQKVWDEGRRIILIRGELLELGPMNPLHATGVRLVNAALLNCFSIGYLVQIQLPLVFGGETDPVPDAAVVVGELRDYLETHPTTASLVVEVADSSLFFDLTTKAELYATANIPEYWVVDLENKQLHVFRDPQPVPENGNAYRTHLTLASAERVSPLAKPDASVSVAELLP